MPELPEVEVVRRGLQQHVVGQTIAAVRVRHPRAVRRHEPGPADLTARLLDARITGTGRRGKYLWLLLSDGEEAGDQALVVHLGMSGQMLLGPVPREDHVRIAALLDDGTALSFVDQRTFGGWMLADIVDVDGSAVPVPVAHLARDPLDPRFDRDEVVKVLRGKHSEIKRQLLDQTVVSGIGNIYADEALWRAKVNGARTAETLTRRQLAEVLDRAAEVMREALAQGGTSFDSLYVNVNGESGYFDRSLDAYGREGVPCRRCGAIDAPGEVHEPIVVLLPALPTETLAFDASTEERYDRTLGRTHRHPALHRAKLARRRGARRLRGRRGRLHPGRVDEGRAGGLQWHEQRPAAGRRLGDDYQATVVVSGAADREQECYPRLAETLQIDLSGLSEEEAERVRVVVRRAVDSVCTVGRTLKSGTEVTFEIADKRS